MPIVHAIAVLGRWMAQALYLALRMLLRPRHKVVLLSRQGDRPSRDFRMLVSELQRREPGLEIVVRCRFVRGGLLDRVAYLGEVLAQMYHLATASVCVVDTYIVPVSVLTHRRSLYVIQMWHALGAVKRFGLQSLGLPSGRSAKVARAMRMHRNYDAVLCGGPGTVAAFAEAFGTDPARVLPLGLPRIDYLLEHAADTPANARSAPVRALCERYPRLLEPGRTVVLYAPTFRGSHTAPPGPEHAAAFTQVVEAFAGERFTLIVKPHDLEAIASAGEHVVDATGVDVAQLLPLCDAVVTDYSAVAFEACVLAKPVYFFVYDIDAYSREQGLNIDPSVELPDATSRDVNELAERIAQGGYNTDAARAFAQRYVSAASGGCTAAIADLVVDHLASS